VRLQEGGRDVQLEVGAGSPLEVGPEILQKQPVSVLAASRPDNMVRSPSPPLPLPRPPHHVVQPNYRNVFFRVFSGGICALFAPIA
jgi:hypothetical protein